MLKKLRRQFILSNMLLVGIVIVLVFCILTVVVYGYERKQTISAMETSLAGNMSVAFFPDGRVASLLPVPKNNDEEVSQERLSSVSLVAVLDKNGSTAVYETSVNYKYSTKDIRNMLSAAMESENETGVLSQYNVRFLRQTMDSGYKVAFADLSSEHSTLFFTLRLDFIAIFCILAVMFLISDYMARKAIEPVEKSWNDQQRFVADASHELKTPLTVILANMDIMQANKDATIWEENKWIENTKSEATRMTELVNDMLFLARSDANIDQSYNFQNINFSKLSEECVLTFESVAFEKGINFTSNIPMDIFLNADETRIKQVIMILIDNALKYVDDKGSIFVTAENLGKQVKFSVANTGPAIEAHKQAHLFERFYRADDSRAREKGGYGLGLSIAQNIIAAHGGKIGLEYSNEKGTCFAFALPIKRS
ncbi:MAG: HAMP domain-containing sensor histidine kinase [Clostridia bacterium]|nr:HAMP domain-containing sensor histidine kinase [Clostridia bacterium]